MELKREESCFADLHIHSRFSRACSKDINIPNLVKWARVKGMNLLGTGDFTHPEWVKELNQLEEREGILYHKDESGREFPFVWQSEISLMYTKGRGRRIHYVVLAPNREVVRQITEFLGSKGRLDYDGRPIFNIKSVDFVEAMEKIDREIEIIPAHCMTPWFGFFGSNSGYDHLAEAFEDKADRIHALESGMSADPEMLWRLNTGKAIVSFSDLHSFWPWRIGREATIFSAPEGRLSYNLIVRQIRENSFLGTVETEPAYGRYHFDGHRNCNFSCSSSESIKLNHICPVCKKPLTVGVESRIEKLAKFPAGYKPANAKPFYKLLPLHEIISLGRGLSVNSKKCWEVYNLLIKDFGNELNILLNADVKTLANSLKNPLLTELIIRNREGKIKINPGYDGVYGQAVLSTNRTDEQKKLF